MISHQDLGNEVSLARRKFASCNESKNWETDQDDDGNPPAAVLGGTQHEQH